jgi:cephalosporin hydroxylase
LDRSTLRVVIGAVILVAAVQFYGASQGTVTDRFHKYFYHSHDTWLKNHWLGVVTLQNPNDVWITQEILHEVRPDFVVETGTGFGGSALIWGMILQQLNPDASVITVDIEDHTEDARAFPIFHEKVDFLLGSSTDPDLFAAIQQRVAGKKVVVILDSDHSEEHVLRELKLYSQIVSVGSYLIVQDTNVNGHPADWSHGPGPMEAVEAFLRERDDFEPDESRERLMLTLHPKGYLKRVK